METDIAKRPRAAGVIMYEVGYHRGSDGLLFAKIAEGHREEQQIDVGSLDYGQVSDDELDALHEDQVDGLLRILSEGLISERSVILVFHAPPLTDTLVPTDEAELSCIDALDPRFVMLSSCPGDGKPASRSPRGRPGRQGAFG